MRIFFRFSLQLVVLCLLAFSARAAIYTVTNTANSGAGSFRQAINDANSNAGDDTINISIPTSDSNCNGAGQCAINLSSGEIVLNNTGTTTVNNTTGASKLELRGNFVQRIFFIDGGARLILNGVTLRDGGGTGGFQPSLDKRGGAIYVQSGEIELNDSVVTDSYVPLTGGEAAISPRGGGIYIAPNGRAAVNNTTVSRNKSRAGAGIYNAGGFLMLNNSTVSANEGTTNDATLSVGGGIYCLAETGGETLITNSTISDNRANDGAGLNTGGLPRITITNSTIAFNTAGHSAGGVGGITAAIDPSSQIKLRNTVIAQNTTTGPSSNPNVFGQYVSGGGNLIGTASAANARGFFAATDIFNSPNSFLGSLSANGGLTQTNLPAANSAAINAGESCVRTQLCPNFNAPVAVSADQRGVSRHDYGNVDIGAVERQFVNITNNTALPNGSQNQFYGEFLFASGGTAPYTFTVTGGALPAGLTLRADGYLNGTPTASGTFNFTVQVSDSSAGSGFADPLRFIELMAPEAVLATKTFQLQVLAPTAATVSVGGKVLTASGRGISGAIVTMTDSNGTVRYARTNPRGVYRFYDVAAGETYVFKASSKRYTFSPPTHIRSIVEETGDVNFTAETGGIIR